MKILAFAATSSTKSINNLLVKYAASQLKDVETEILDINDYELPLFSEDREAQLGQPELARAFLDKIANSDAVIISFAEHNGSYTVAYKNIFDWASRINPKVFQNKPMVLLATSPGPGGASSVLAAATASAPYFDGVVKASLSVPGFYDNFDIEQRRITTDEINGQLLSAVNSLVEGSDSVTRQVA
ncbi:MAG: NAD(P)H-dependent oxidoreductase [Gammaproteobacteria bacterium]|nr:NAD(P)H-dependent oxidoreductase [Gammaproteobacteria bacterium]